MGVLLIPLAFAGVGGLLFGNIGMAAGWLIGAWLFGPKASTDNQIFDPGAQEMPRFNQSLRGVTMPIYFGTNRVASNIVWVKNFQTIRHETQGSGQAGGKGGGSGGGGKSGGGAGTGTQVSYEYKWDMLFHIGMSPEPYGLYGGWSNTQRIVADNIQEIATSTGGDASGNQVVTNCNTAAGQTLSLLPPCTPNKVTNSVNGGAAVQQTDNTATLTFDDVFYGAGGATGNDAYFNWDYFEAQEGSPTRWPFTEYVGFKGLSLGSSPSVPQLSWEVGPGTAEFSCDSTFLGVQDVASSSVYGLNGTNSMMVGENGKHYILINDGSAFNQNLVLWCIDDQTTTTIDNSLGPLGATDSLFFPMGGSPYFMWVQWDFPGGLHVTWTGRIYKINSSGTLEISGTASGDSTNSHEWMFKMHPVAFAFMSFDGIMKQDTGYPTWVVSNGNGAALLIIPPFGGVPAHYPLRIPNPGGDDAILTILDGDPVFDADTGSSIDTRCRAFIVPEYHPESGLGTDCNWPVWYSVKIYFSKSMANFQVDGSPITTSPLAQTFYPDGGVAKITLAGGISDAAFPGPCDDHKIRVIGLGPDEDQFVSNDNAAFVNADGTPFFPIADAMQDKDGTVHIGSDYFAPTISKHETGAVILCWPRVYLTSDDLTASGSNSKVLVQVWNPVDKQGKTYSQKVCNLFDQATDFPDATGGHVNIPTEVIPYYDQAYGVVLVVANYVGAHSDIGSVTLSSIFGPLKIGGGADVLPPYIVYQILTNPIFGMGIPAASIDQDAYELALQYCDAEDIRVSVQYLREESVLGIIEELLSLYGGYLIDSGGKVKFGVQKFTSTPVRTIDNDHLVVDKPGDPPVTVTKGALQDGFNKIRVNFYDRNLDYRQNQVEVGDEVDQDFNGIRFKEFQPRFVMKVGTAQKIAERALWTNLFARDTYDFMLGWKDADLEPGDVITLVDSYHPELSGGKTVRITKWQEKARGQFSVNGVLEVEYAMTASHSDAISDVTSASGTKGTNVDVLPAADFRMYELPREFQASQAKLYVGYNQQSNIRGALLYLSPDGVTYAQAAGAEPFVISGIFAAPLPAVSPGDLERNVDVWLMPNSGFSTATPTFCQTLALDDISELQRAAGGAVFYAGSEAMSAEGLTLIGQNHYRINRLYRGWGGTLTQAHTSGAYWHRHGNGIFQQEIDPNKLGTNIYYKVAPYNFGGVQYDISSIEGKVYQIKGVYWLPQNMGDIRVNVESPLLGSSADVQVSPYYRGIDATLKSNVTFAWEDTARQEGYGFGGFGVNAYGHFTDDVDFRRWRVEIVSGNTVVRSTAVASGAFTYTVAQNSADFNGFAGVYGVRVTPFNSYGDAPINNVRSINLFW